MKWEAGIEAECQLHVGRHICPEASLVWRPFRAACQWAVSRFDFSLWNRNRNGQHLGGVPLLSPSSLLFRFVDRLSKRNYRWGRYLHLMFVCLRSSFSIPLTE